MQYAKYLIHVLLLLGQSMLLLADQANSSKADAIHYMDYLRMVLEANPDIQQQRLNWGVAGVAVDDAAAEFEPALSIDLTTSDDSKPRAVTPNELVDRVVNQQEDIEGKIDGHEGMAIERIPSGTDDVSISVSKKIKTGATLGVSVITQKDRYYNMSSENQSNGEYVSYVGMTFTQPLLQGLGKQVNYAQWRAAEKAQSAAQQEWRQQVADTLLTAGSVYWDLYLAQQQLDIRLASLKIAQDLLADQKLMLTHGAGSRTDVVDGEVGVSIRFSDLAVAQQQHGTMARTMRKMAMMSSAISDTHLTDTLQVQPVQLIAVDQIKQAYRQSPTYLRQLILLSQEEERLVYAADQLNPQLDLKGNYGFNGLGENYGHSFGLIQKKSYPKWSVGVSLSASLGKYKKARSEIIVAHLRKIHALKRLRATKIELEDDIHTIVAQITRSWDQIVSLRKAVANTVEQFEVAQQQRAAGVGTARLVLERESERNRLREMLLTAEVDYQKSILVLSHLDGTLLLDFKLESGPDYN